MKKRLIEWHLDAIRLSEGVTFNQIYHCRMVVWIDANIPYKNGADRVKYEEYVSKCKAWGIYECGEHHFNF